MLCNQKVRKLDSNPFSTVRDWLSFCRNYSLTIGGKRMKLKAILFSLLVGSFVFMMTPDIQSGFTPKCGIEQAYAMGRWWPPQPPPPGHRPPPPPPGHGGRPRPDPTPVPEPSGIILLGIGLAAVGGYYAFRSRKK